MRSRNCNNHIRSASILGSLDLTGVFTYVISWKYTGEHMHVLCARLFIIVISEGAPDIR